MTDSRRPVGIAILARAPVPGTAKTRLIPTLGPQGAANLQRWLLRRAVATAQAAQLGPLTLWCADDPEHPEFAACAASGEVTLQRQPAGDLGTRMLAALCASPTPQGTLLIGADCPALTAEHLRRAAQCLHDHDAVFLPAEDGGYVLAGMRAAEPHVFAQMAWGTHRVMAQTRQRLLDLAWQWAEPLTLWDVDRPEDFARLAALAPELCCELGLQPNSP